MAQISDVLLPASFEPPNFAGSKGFAQSARPCYAAVAIQAKYDKVLHVIVSRVAVDVMYLDVPVSLTTD